MDQSIISTELIQAGLKVKIKKTTTQKETVLEDDCSKVMEKHQLLVTSLSILTNNQMRILRHYHHLEIQFTHNWVMLCN